MSELQGIEEKIELVWLGKTVFTVRFPCRGNSKGTVLLLHGLGDHVGRYDWAIRLLHEQGFDVLGIDWPGGGRSSGIRGDLPIVDDACRLLSEILGKLDEAPVGVLAHSTGGFFLAHFLSRRLESLRSLQWAWFSSPLLDPSYGQSVLKIGAAKLLAKLIPTLTLSTGVSPRDCFHTGGDPAKREMAEGVHDRISLRFGRDLLDPEKKAELVASKIDPGISIFLTQGAGDHVCSPEVAGSFYSRLAARDSTFLLVAGARHEPFREPENQAFLNQVRTWLGQRDSQCLA